MWDLTDVLEGEVLGKGTKTQVSSLASSHRGEAETSPYQGQHTNSPAASHLRASPGASEMEDLRAKIQAWLKDLLRCPGAGELALCQRLQEAKRVWSSVALLCQALSPSTAMTCLFAGTGCEPPDGESWAQGPWYFFVTSHKVRPTLLSLC